MRYAWVDNAKAIGITLVVMGHVNRGLHSSGIYISERLFTLLDSIIYTFHMPLFFFLSGLFFVSSIEKNGKKKFLSTKLDTIVYPYIIWSILQGGVEVLLSKYTNSKTDLIEVLSFFIYPRAQFWFLYALSMIFLVAILVYRKENFNKSLPITIVISFFAYLLTNTIGSSFHVNYITNYMCFFLIGCLCSKISIEKSIPLIQSKTVLLATFVTFCTIQYIFHVKLQLNYLNIGLMTFIIAITGIAFISLLSIHLSKMKIRSLEIIGKLSMVIYLVHILAGSGSRVILNNFFHIKNWHAHFILGTIAGITLPIIFYTVTKKININFLFSRPKRS